MTIGKNIAELRKNSGMTQEQLAEMLGVTPQTISKWENDTNMPDILLLPTIAGCFGITVDELYGGRAPKPRCEPVDYDQLPEMVYDTIIDLTQRGWVATAENRDIDEEKSRMKAYLEGDRRVKTATFTYRGGGGLVATSEIALLHRGKANGDQLIGEGIGRVLEVLSSSAVRKIFAYQTEHGTEFLTSTYAAKKCGITSEEAKEALESLTKIHVNHRIDVKEDEDRTLPIYTLRSGEWTMFVLMILKTARLLDEDHYHYFNYRGSDNFQWLK